MLLETRGNAPDTFVEKIKVIVSSDEDYSRVVLTSYLLWREIYASPISSDLAERVLKVFLSVNAGENASRGLKSILEKCADCNFFNEDTHKHVLSVISSYPEISDDDRNFFVSVTANEKVGSHRI
jgi:hypothetical protein